MCVAMIFKFDHDPASSHLVSDRSRGSRARKRVEHQITRFRRELKQLLNEDLRFLAAAELDSPLVPTVTKRIGHIHEVRDRHLSLSLTGRDPTGNSLVILAFCRICPLRPCKVPVSEAVFADAINLI